MQAFEHEFERRGGAAGSPAPSFFRAGCSARLGDLAHVLGDGIESATSIEAALEAGHDRVQLAA